MARRKHFSSTKSKALRDLKRRGVSKRSEHAAIEEFVLLNTEVRKSARKGECAQALKRMKMVSLSPYRSPLRHYATFEQMKRAHKLVNLADHTSKIVRRACLKDD